KGKCLTISPRTRSVAVEVKTINSTAGNVSRNCVNCRYSGRKSCAHSLMQYDSSTAKSVTFHHCKSARNPERTSRSRPTQSKRNALLRQRTKRSKTEILVQQRKERRNISSHT